MTDTPHYVTPEEAKEKICPHKPNQMSVWCEGPKCMAFRWQEVGRDFSKLDHNHSPTLVYSITHGFCGMVRHG